MDIYDRFVEIGKKAYYAGVTLVTGFEFYRAYEFYSNNQTEAAAGTAAVGAMILFAGAGIPKLIKRQNTLDGRFKREQELNNNPDVIVLADRKKAKQLEDIAETAQRH